MVMSFIKKISSYFGGSKSTIGQNNSAGDNSTGSGTPNNRENKAELSNSATEIQDTEKAVEKYIATLLTIYEDKNKDRASGKENAINNAKSDLRSALSLGDTNAKANAAMDKIEKKVKRKMSFIPSISLLGSKKSQAIEKDNGKNAKLKLLESTSFKIDRRIFSPQATTRTLNAVNKMVTDNTNRVHLKKSSGITI